MRARPSACPLRLRSVHEFPAEWRGSCTKYDERRYRHGDGNGETKIHRSPARSRLPLGRPARRRSPEIGRRIILKPPEGGKAERTDPDDARSALKHGFALKQIRHNM